MAGTRKIGIDNAVKIAKRFGVDVRELVLGSLDSAKKNMRI